MEKTNKRTKQRFPIPRDREILEAVKPIADGIAVMFGENCEVSVRALAATDHPIIHMANGHTSKLSVGSRITDLEMTLLKEFTNNTKNVTECYYSETSEGKTSRSVTILIRNASDKPIGMLTINFNMSAPILSLLNFSKNIQSKTLQTEKSDNIEVNNGNFIRTVLQNTIKYVNNQKLIPNHEKNKTIITDLIKKGIFDIRGAIHIVARELSVSRYTIYYYIRENRISMNKKSV